MLFQDPFVIFAPLSAVFETPCVQAGVSRCERRTSRKFPGCRATTTSGAQTLTTQKHGQRGTGRKLFGFWWAVFKNQGAPGRSFDFYFPFRQWGAVGLNVERFFVSK